MRHTQALSSGQPAAAIAGQSCPLCGAGDVARFEAPYPLFGHLDFAEIAPGPTRLGRCSGCGLVFRIVEATEILAVTDIYRGAAYAAAPAVVHMVRVDGFEEPAPQARLQAELLAPSLPKRGARVLDIGCADGALLRALDAVVEASDLCGFDVAERPRFPRGRPFRFVAGDLAGVCGTFDLIVMSHSLQYVPDLGALAGHIAARLAPEGALFVQVPDFSRKTAALLFGDLFWHFTPRSLSSVLARLGFAAQPLDNRWFPRDVLMLAHLEPIVPSVPVADDRALQDGLAELRRMAEVVAALPASESTGILGTTIDASFVASQLGARVGFFVDENPEKVGTEFRGRPVIRPEAVPPAACVAVPLAAQGPRIATRLGRTHPGRWVAV